MSAHRMAAPSAWASRACVFIPLPPMQTRLVTTCEEAKALKETGWPKRLTFYGCRYEEIVQGKHKLQPSPTYSRPLYAGEIAAARLAELLAFLWERDIEADFFLLKDAPALALWG